MYSKFQIKDHKLIVGTSIAERLWENLARFSGIYFLITIIVATLVCLLFVVFNKRILTPLINLNRNANKILADNDLTTPLPIEAQSQIGQITKCINLIIARLRNMLLDLRETCNKFADITASLQAAGSDITANATAIRTDITTTKETMNELNNSFGSVAAKLQELNAQSERGSTTVYQMGQVNQEVFENVTSMSASVSQSIAAIAQMSEAIQETATHVAQLNSDIGSVDVAMQRLSSSITMEENSSKDSLILAKELAVNADAGMQALKKTIDGIALMQKSSDDTAAVIRTLGNHAMDIGNILHVIDDVTKQTGLLALNAAIISAQAGEHGRGFAVVADEIGALASRTKDSTKEIAELIDTIQNEAKMAVAVMEESNSTIERGAKLGAEAARAFDKLKESADKSTAQAKILAEATAEQSTDVKNVTQAIASITGTVEAINHSARRQADEAAALNQAANKMNMLNQQVARSSEEQARSAKEVLRVIQNISKMAEAVNGRQIAQTEGTKLAVSTISAVGNCANLQDESTGRLTRAIDEISHHIGKLQSYTKEFKIS
jgi:methyl-accepting chemotaxis protein